MTPTFRNFLVLAAASALAVATQLNWLPSSYTPAGYVPFGNDAFYHSRRILDTVADPASFYEFDDKIHAPDGSLLVWPWGYDYLMATLVRVGLVLGITGDPMTVLVYLPVAAVLLSLLLLLLIARSLEMGTFASAGLLCSVAVLPLTGSLHGVGQVDHHWAEYVMVLAFLAASLAWARRPGSLRRAVTLGAVLGVAPAFHNGLFVLQAVLLGWAFLLWLKTVPMPRASAAGFGLSLVLTTLAVLLPSQPFREGYFEYYLLSWFHLYVASASVLVFFALSRCQRTLRGAAAVVGICLVMALPIMDKALGLGSFVGKADPSLKGIMEAQSLISLAVQVGLDVVVAYYSWFLLLAPVVWLGGLITIVRAGSREMVLFGLYAACALPLLLMQFRFHYYASPALFIGGMLLVDRVSRLSPSKWPGLLLAGLVVLAMFPSARYSWTRSFALGGDNYYEITAAASFALGQACLERPGIVLARPNDGHMLRFHTECSVIANNFLLTPQHFEAHRRANGMFELTPQELLNTQPTVDYVFVRVRAALGQSERGTMLLSREQANQFASRLDDALLWGNPADLPPEFELIGEIPGPLDYPLARVYRINRDATRSPAS